MAKIIQNNFPNRNSHIICNPQKLSHFAIFYKTYSKRDASPTRVSPGWALASPGTLGPEYGMKKRITDEQSMNERWTNDEWFNERTTNGI
jgi:hypothetical protein